MVTTIQIRSVDERLAEAAKQRAASQRQSLSDYLKGLIVQDLHVQDARAHRRALYEEITNDPDRPRVSREATAAALRQARGEMGMA